jgi:integrase
VVPLPGVVADLLNRVQRKAVEKKLSVDPGAYVLGRRPGKPARKKFFGEALRAELTALGIAEEERAARNITFHSLRHDFVTMGRIAGMTDFEIMTLARHHDHKMLARYSHGQQALDFAAMRGKIEAGLAEKKSLPGPGQ